MNEALIPNKRPLGAQLATGVSAPSLYKSSLTIQSGHVPTDSNLWFGSVNNELPEGFMNFSVIENGELIREESEETLTSPTPSMMSFTSADNMRYEYEIPRGDVSDHEAVDSDGMADESEFFDGLNSYGRDSAVSKLAWGRLTPTLSSTGALQVYNDVMDTARNPMYISRANSPASFHHDYVPKELMKSLTKTDSFANTTGSSTTRTTIRNPTIRNTFIIGKIQTSFDIRNYIDFHEVIAYSSGRTNSKLRISVLTRNTDNQAYTLANSNKIIEIDVHSRIKSIQIPTLAKMYTRYSDLLAVITDRSLVLIKIKSIDNQNGTMKYNVMDPLDFTTFGDYPFADVTFNPMDPQQFAVVDTKGNWTMGTIPTQLKRSSKLQLSSTNRGTIYDPEALSHRKHIAWSTNNSRILVSDETKIMELDLNEMVQTEIVVAKTWSSLLDLVELTDDYKVLLTSMEIIIMHIDREKDEVTRILSWKHDLDPLDPTYRMFIQEVVLQGRTLYFTYTCSKNHNMVYLKAFTLDTKNNTIQALKGSSIIEIPSMTNGIQNIEFAEEVIDDVDNDFGVQLSIFVREYDSGIIKKLTLSNVKDSNTSIEHITSDMPNIVDDDIIDLTHVPTEIQAFQNETIRVLYDTISKMKKLSDNHDVKTLEEYGYHLSEAMNKFIQADETDDISDTGLLKDLYQPPSDFRDIEEYSSFLIQFFEHYQNENVSFTDLKKIFKWFIKDDASNIDIFYNKLHQCWALTGEDSEFYSKEIVKQVIGSSLGYSRTNYYQQKTEELLETLDDKTKELLSEWGSESHDDDDLETQSTVPQSSQPQFTLNSQSQIPTIRSSQSRVEKKRPRTPAYTKKIFSNISATENDLASQNSLPSSMAPAFSLGATSAASTQQSQNITMGSSQLSGSQRTKKKKKKKIGGFA